MLFWAIFCPFTTLLTLKIKIWKKYGKKHLEILSFCKCVPLSENHTIYGSWDMNRGRQKFCCFGSFFYPFTPLTIQKIKILKKWKKKSWRYYHFTQVHQKSWSYAILFLRYCTRQMDTVINVVPNPDISKTHEINFFQLYQKHKFLHPEILSGYIWVWYGTIQYKKLKFFR